MLDWSKYEVETIPTPPPLVKPNRAAFDSNTAWGVALDEWEAQVEERRKHVSEIREKNAKAQSEAYAKFRKDLIEDLGWEWMTEQQIAAALDDAYQRGHSAGISEVYSIACELDDLLRHFKP